nr:MAG TPA: hypothetical protein [Caudoviricetes sp.]
MRCKLASRGTVPFRQRVTTDLLNPISSATADGDFFIFEHSSINVK